MGVGAPAPSDRGARTHMRFLCGCGAHCRLRSEPFCTFSAPCPRLVAQLTHSPHPSRRGEPCWSGQGVVLTAAGIAEQDCRGHRERRVGAALPVACVAQSTADGVTRPSACFRSFVFLQRFFRVWF